MSSPKVTTASYQPSARRTSCSRNVDLIDDTDPPRKSYSYLLRPCNIPPDTKQAVGCVPQDILAHSIPAQGTSFVNVAIAHCCFSCFVHSELNEEPLCLTCNVVEPKLTSDKANFKIRQVTVFRDVTPYGLVDRNQRFGDTCCQYLQGRRVIFWDVRPKFWYPSTSTKLHGDTS